jgi:hypothetical protein
VTDGRDVAWASSTRLLFTRTDKLFAVDLAGPSPRGGTLPIQISFDPPAYAASANFVDRHPDAASDGGTIFDSVGRQNVADMYLEAFEVDRQVFPPETLATDAFILYRPPGGVGAYPIFEGADTLRTPARLRSLPVGAGGDFEFGVRLDGRFLSDSTRETYCDTTITQVADLQPGDSDTLRYHFEIARGTLRVQTFATNTTVTWTRRDGRVTGAGTLANAGESRNWGCLLSYEVVRGVPAPPTLEEYIVSGSRAGSAIRDDGCDPRRGPRC